MFAEELHNLLHAAGLQAPYILVAHSMAGFTIRLYTARYRPDVAGIVLVDSSHPDQFKRLPPDPPGTNAKCIQETEFAELTEPVGIPQLLGYCGDSAALRAAECTFDSARENASSAVHFGRMLPKPAGQAIPETAPSSAIANVEVVRNALIGARKSGER